MNDMSKIRLNNKYRNYNLRKYITVVCCTFMLSVICSVTFFAIGNKAEAKENENKFKYYTQIEVAYGITLEDIAEEYSSDYYNSKEFLREVRQINSLYHDDIRPGTSLIIPYYDTVLK